MKNPIANVVLATGIHKSNVPADLHELLSAAKNLPELSIRIFNPIKIPNVPDDLEIVVQVRAEANYIGYAERSRQSKKLICRN